MKLLISIFFIFMLLSCNRFFQKNDEKKFYTSIEDTCGEYYQIHMEKLINKYFHKNIMLKIIRENKNVFLIDFHKPFTGSVIIDIRQYDTTLFKKNDIIKLKSYIIKNAGFNYCFFEQGEFVGQHKYGSPISTIIQIPNERTKLRYSIKIK